MHFFTPDFDMKQIFFPILLSACATLPLVTLAQTPDDESVEELHADFTELAAESFPSSDELSAERQPTGYVPYDYVNTVTGQAPYRRTPRGIFVVGRGDSVRAFDTFGGTLSSARAYAASVNKYAETFPDVKIWVMPIPTASAYYTPDDAASLPKSTHEFIRAMFEALDPAAEGIDLFPVLAQHVDEPIYSRTDHHWAPLGAYYAARSFASAAEVPFISLDDYDRHVVENYVGTMYQFSKDTSVKNAPEDFVYYTPRDIDVQTTYITYSLDRSRRRVVSETEPREGKFFLPFKGAATYCTFMGGDSKLTKVVTPTKNGRKLIILKDSFGNAIPGYLFGSFEEIHVIDCRYFSKNMRQYVADNGITDILFANNVTHASTARTYNMYITYLNQ